MIHVHCGTHGQGKSTHTTSCGRELLQPPRCCPPQTGAPPRSTATTHSSQIGLWQLSILVIIPWGANLLPLLEEAWTEHRESKKSGGEAVLQMTSWVLTREQPHQQMMAFVLKLLGRSNERTGTKSFSSLLQRHIQKTPGKKRQGN